MRTPLHPFSVNRRSFLIRAAGGNGGDSVRGRDAPWTGHQRTHTHTHTKPTQALGEDPGFIRAASIVAAADVSVHAIMRN